MARDNEFKQADSARPIGRPKVTAADGEASGDEPTPSNAEPDLSAPNGGPPAGGKVEVGSNHSATVPP